MKGFGPQHRWRVLRCYFITSLAVQLQYRAAMSIWLIGSVLEPLVYLVVWTTVARLQGGSVDGHTPALAGWQPMELVALLGIYSFMNGFIQTFVQPGIDRFLADIHRGTFDFVLTKPRDAQLWVAMRRISIWSLLDAALGLAVLGVALVRPERPFGPARGLALVVVMAAGMMIVGSFWFILATIAFWFVKIENILFVFQSTYQAGRWPISIYPRPLRIAFTFLVPVAFAVTVPAEAAVSRLDGRTLLLAVGLATGLAGAARGFWSLGVRRYSGASA